MSLNEEKDLTREWLDQHELPYTRISARTVSFLDLARASCVFVKVHGWEPNALAGELITFVKQFGFRVEFSNRS